MKTTKAGVDLIVRYEGLELRAYPDPGSGGEPWTIGVGHTSRAGLPHVTPGMTITRSQAIEILERDLETFEKGVARLVKVDLLPHQWSALNSFAFNLGLAAFGRSSALREVNAGRFDRVPAKLQLYVKAAGRVLPGLVKRRAAEARMFGGSQVVQLMGGGGQAPAPDEVVEMAAFRGRIEAIPDDEDPLRIRPKPVLKHRKVWAAITGWLGGSGISALGMLQGWDWQAMLVLVLAISAWAAVFLWLYRDEIRAGMFASRA